ncbi:hypothetical protein [Pantoea ananatis]|uniref:hypothetical protein n=1 Tax=Pantoea ananas TaxID=553 RepID=UPI001B316E88|nr:hypothetical protein [Pantoea ananatis]
MTKEQQIEQDLIAKLQDLKYTYHSDIRDKASLEQNFRKKFEALNRVNLSDAEFNRLREEIITADVFLAAQVLREKGKLDLLGRSWKSNWCEGRTRISHPID